jgi:hypothetical protein
MNLKRLFLYTMLAGMAGVASAQTANPSGVSLTDASNPGAGDFEVVASQNGTAVFDFNYVAQNSITDFRVDITYDATRLTPQATGADIDGCLANIPASHDNQFTGCNLQSAGVIRVAI